MSKKKVTDKKDSQRILLNDFEVLSNQVLNHVQSTFLQRQIEKKLLTLCACTENVQGIDGLTTFETQNLMKVGKKKPYNRKHVKVCVNKKVLKSSVMCWRLAVLLHELGHALHFFSNHVSINRLVQSHLHHGKCWKKTLERAIRGGKKNEKLKLCAGFEESPSETCLFKGTCSWCGPKNKRIRNKMMKGKQKR